jgi:FAD synthetase
MRSRASASQCTTPYVLVYYPLSLNRPPPHPSPRCPSALRRSDGGYEPAYKLADGRLERVGRVHVAARKPPHPQLHPHLHPTDQTAPQPGPADPQSPGPRAEQQAQEEDRLSDGRTLTTAAVEVTAMDGAPAARTDESARRSGSGGDGRGGGGGSSGGHSGAACLTHSAAIVIIGDELLSGKVSRLPGRAPGSYYISLTPLPA